ncbi:MAG: putative CXXCH cytochrome family protein [Zhongshania sp.]|jgi:predicted CXXCH cytochrome family protein
MLILIRTTRLKNGKLIDQIDSELEVNKINVGSGNHCDIQLFGDDIADKHCDLRILDQGHLQLTCHSSTKVTIAGVDLKKAAVEIGSWIDIGAHKIALDSPPPGFDAALIVQVDVDSQPSIQTRYKQELQLKLPSSRRWSYALGLLILLGAFIVPLLQYAQPDTAQKLQQLGLPSDEIWSSGPLSGPHHVAGLVENCNSCHTKGFQQVDTASCVSCHSDSHRHFPVEHPFSSHSDTDCQACHKEHNEPEMLIVKNNQLCVNCHITPIQGITSQLTTNTEVVTEIAASSAFTANKHPDFLPTLLQAQADDWTLKKALPSTILKEQSNLKFPHQLHLNTEKVGKEIAGSSKKSALICGDCHTPTPGGEHFAPISMETSCASCHSLDFDDLNPQRRLPHAAPEAVYTFLQEFYISQAASQRYAKVKQLPRRVPGLNTIARCDKQDPLQCGGDWASEEMDRLFTKGGCVDCHEVYKNASLDKAQQWQVKTVKLTADWYPAAHFSHSAHHIMSADTIGKEACTSCHKAQSSELSSDVLVPTMGICLDCHDEAAKSSIILQCIDCHVFHDAMLPVMTAPTAGDKK